jgi:5S rRNA maturation endonuclease (ribonuclease M5)
VTVVQVHDPRGPVAAILDRLDKVRRGSGGWIARCPAHDDRNPSLSVAEGGDGRVLLNCHAGCTAQAIVQALGLTEAELFPPREETLRETTVYRYEDENGTHLYDVVRFEPKTFRQRRPDGTWGLGDTRRVLYRLPQVRAAAELGQVVYVVEGEKDADAILRAGAAATCNPMGAGKWRDEYAHQLAGTAQVVVVADADDPGIAHATQVAQSLERARIPHRIVMPAAGKDTVDHLAAGHTLEQLVTRIPPAAETAVRIVPLDEFVSVTEDVAEPLIGTPEDSLLPSDGLLLMYGDGGAGKTTLSIDALGHLAAGINWLGIAVSRPLRIMLIENEGPRGPFRQRLAAKINAWTGPDFAQNVYVLEEPWTRFTLTDETYRRELAQAIDEHNIDLVIVGPLASLGAKGTGTPDEINEFDDHVKDLRAQAARPFALWIVHHENKAGDVSGAWERYPDSLVHVQAQGNGRTRVFWRKVRWSSSLHGTSSNLIWADGNGFEIEEVLERDYRAELVAAFTKSNGWRTISEAKKLIKANQDKTKHALSQLVESGQFTYERGPEGRKKNAVCWKLSTDPDTPGNHGSVTPLEGSTRATDPLTRPINGSEGGSVESEPREVTSPTPGEEEEIERLLDKYSDILDDKPTF